MAHRPRLLQCTEIPRRPHLKLVGGRGGDGGGPGGWGGLGGGGGWENPKCSTASALKLSSLGSLANSAVAPWSFNGPRAG